MRSTATIDATRGERVGMDERITLDDAVVVHDFLIHQDANGGWWATNDGVIRYAPDLDGLLVQVAEATGTSTDLADLHGRFDRARERVARRAAEDQALEVLDGQ